MKHEFQNGDKITLRNGEEAKVVEKLGEGGQGAVYKVKIGIKEYALKWYHIGVIPNIKKFYKNLENNIAKGSPSDAFLWPLHLTEQAGGSFGYVMELRPDNYKEFSEFLLARVRFASLSTAVNASLNITNGFRELHRRGFSYQDLNDGNFFIDPLNGNVLICDNDNVAPYGENLGIAGKARYMAPEVVRNKKKPDVMTDRFSLTVVLFRLLFLDHPLEGKRVVESPCLTEELELKYYGKDPIFIYDKDDDSNRPVRGVHPNALRFWPLYPKFIREKFEFALSKDAMHGKIARPTDNDWQIAFTELRSSIVTCPCGGETFLDLSGDSLCVCCGMKIPKPPVLSLQGRYKVALFPEMKLYKCHTDRDSDDYKEIAGEVIRNPKQPTIWGLRNLSDTIWNVEYKDGTSKILSKGEVAVVTKIKQIQFPNGVGTVI